MRTFFILLLGIWTGCRTVDAPNLTGTWRGTATPSDGDFLPGGAIVDAELHDSEGGAYFGSVTFDSDLGEQVFDVGAPGFGNRIELEGQDVADELDIRLLLDVSVDDDHLEGTWTMGEIDCLDCSGSGTGSIGLQR